MAPNDDLSDDDRSPIAVASEWSSRIMTIALEMVLPGVGGMWLDRRLGTKFVFTLGGFGLGMTAALWHLTHLVQPTGTSNTAKSNSAKPNSSPDNRHHP